jgi:hypothetical protein
MKKSWTAIAAIAVCITEAACDGAKELATPTAPPTAVSTVPTGTFDLGIFRIVSGADQSPIEGAAVLVDGAAYTSRSDGRLSDRSVYVARTAAIDIDAPGYLPRRSLLAHAADLALWPIEGDDEKEATRQMVYERDGVMRDLFIPAERPIYVTTSLAPEILNIWKDVANQLAPKLGVVFEFAAFMQYAQNEMLVSVDKGGQARCSHVPAWGFCWEPSPYPTVTVLQDRLTDRTTIARVLVSFFLGANPLPGFMNAQAPADSLTPLEGRTVRMILQRPHKNRWPDTDR